MSQAKSDYVAWVLTRSNMSPTSKKCYVSTVRRFEDVTGVSIASATHNHVEAFLATYDNEGSKATNYSHLNKAMKWLMREKLRSDNPCVVVDRPTAPGPNPNPPEPAQVRDALAAAEAAGDLRMYVWIAVEATCGTRCAETAALRVEDITFGAQPMLKVRKGKGNKARQVPLNELAATALRRWISENNLSEGWLFPSRKAVKRGDHIGYHRVSRAMSLFLKPLGIDHGHLLRHYYGTKLAENETPIEEAADLMGHATLEMSLHYRKINKVRQMERVRKVDFLADNAGTAPTAPAGFLSPADAAAMAAQAAAKAAAEAVAAVLAQQTQPAPAATQEASQPAPLRLVQ